MFTMIGLLLLSGIYPTWFCFIVGIAIAVLISLMLEACMDEDDD